MKHLRRCKSERRAGSTTTSTQSKEDVVAHCRTPAAAAASRTSRWAARCLFARLGSGFGRRHGWTLPARRARHLRLLRHLLLAGAGARPPE